MSRGLHTLTEAKNMMLCSAVLCLAASPARWQLRYLPPQLSSLSTLTERSRESVGVNVFYSVRSVLGQIPIA